MTKTTKRRIICVMLTSLMLMSLILTGCGGNSDSNTTDGNNDQSQSSVNRGDDSNVTETGKTDYAVILKTLSDDYWAKMKDGIENEAREHGVKVDIFDVDSEDDADNQLKIFEKCIAKGYKAIGVAPISATNLIEAIAQANEKDIYVVNIDEKLDMDKLKSAGGSVMAFAATDNVEAGEKGAEYIIDKIDEEGEVAIIEGKKGDTYGEERKQGATDAFKDEDKIKLVSSQSADWDREKARNTTEGIIKKHPNLKAIYCCDDTMALGAIQAVKDADKLGEIIVVGTDGSKEAIKSIEAGELTATVAHDSPEIGAASLRKMLKTVHDGEKIDIEKSPDTISIDPYIVDKDSVK